MAQPEHISSIRIDSGRIGALQNSSCWSANNPTTGPTITSTNMPSISPTNTY